MTEPTPRALGFRMPAEWEPHAATWLSWPRAEGISFPGLYERVPHLWLRMIEEMGCDEAQGYLIASPRAGPELGAWMERGGWR